MNTDNIIKKYKTFIRTGNIISAIVALLIILLPGNLLSIPFAFIFYLIAIKVITTLAVNNVIFPVLKQNADPEAFSQILEKMKVCTANATEHIISSYLLGDYNKTINICNEKIKDPSQQRYAHIYYTYLARCYFDIGDEQQLKTVCKQFEQMTNSVKNGKELRQKCTLMRFYNLYLDNDYEACKEIYKKILNSKDFGDDLLSEIQTKYTYAVACFHTNDFQTAKEIFSYITECAPKFNYAKLSRAYLESIETAEPLKKESITLEECGFSSLPDFKGKKNTAKIILYTGLFISLLIVVIFTITQTDMSFKLF